LGYVFTDSGLQRQADPNATPPRPDSTEGAIRSFIKQWYDKYQLDGIFFDVGPYPPDNPVTSTVKQFYHNIYGYVKNISSEPGILLPVRGTLVLLNASEYREVDGYWIMAGPQQGCDIANLFEGDWTKYSTNYTPASWWANYPNRVSHIIHHCQEANLCQAVALSVARNADYVYVYDGGGTNPNYTSYDHLTVYWQKEVAVVTLKHNNDFYVRDWTNTPSSYDQGGEPSTNPTFWVTSDVWNRLSNNPPQAASLMLTISRSMKNHGLVYYWMAARITLSHASTVSPVAGR
jgi:hypothetical protein